MRMNQYLRGAAIIVRAAAELAFHSLMFPARRAVICRRTGKVRAA